MLSTEAFICPPTLLDRARGTPRVRTAIVGAGDRLALESARLATEAGLIEPCLVGDERAIDRAAESLGWDIGALRTVIAADEDEAARSAVALARDGEVCALMKGGVHTDAIMRAVVSRDAGLRTERRISHVFHMSVPGRTGSLVISDAAVNIAPDVDQKLDIVRNVVTLMHALGNPMPRIAMLSATEQVNPAVLSSVHAADVCRRASAGEVTGALVEGPFALDIAISPQAAAQKGVASEVAGRAGALVVPNIETGNALFKAMVYLLSATAAGLVLGARVPVMLTSRADPPEARLASAALAAIVAAHGHD